MEKELQRDLGLVSVIAISMGAMIGSGIFILPGLAMALAGPAVILAFVIAGLLVLPAALSIAELGAAIPDAGGDYVFIERGMGPIAGTIAGLGTWLMLMFKGALALLGGMFYLELLIWLPDPAVAAVLLGTILIVVNLIGVKQTGNLQSVMVLVMVIILGVFVVFTIIRVEQAQYQPFFAEGSSGLFAATAMLLVTYAGVTKVAAVAEEIENPGRNLPLGLLVSLISTALLYALIAFVLVGMVDADLLAGSNVPMADAVTPVWGTVGVVAIVLAAILALVSTANAGILTASRYPLALSRDNLIPPVFEYIHPRFATPSIAIGLTGGVMLFIVVALPVEEIAKTAGAFQIIVYMLVCMALIFFREQNPEWYSPEFRSPAYPWVQIFGILSGAFIITQMDMVPIIGAVGILVFGSLWYQFYAADRVDRSGIAFDAMRRTAGRQFIQETQEELHKAPRTGHVVVAIRRDIGVDEERLLLRIAEPVAKARDTDVRVVRFEEVPDQFPLDRAAGEISPADIRFETQTNEIASELDISVDVEEIVSHDTKHALRNYLHEVDADLLITRADPVKRLNTLLGRDMDWVIDRAPCDVVFVQLGELVDIDEISIVTDRSPFNDPLKVALGDAIASTLGANLRFVFAVDEDASDQMLETITEYHDELDNECEAPVDGIVRKTDRPTRTLVQEMERSDLVLLSTTTHRLVPDLLIRQQSDRLAERLDIPVLLVHSEKSWRGSFLEPLVERVLFKD